MFNVSKYKLLSVGKYRLSSSFGCSLPDAAADCDASVGIGAVELATWVCAGCEDDSMPTEQSAYAGLLD